MSDPTSDDRSRPRWRPRSVRHNPERHDEWDVLFDGIPPHVQRPVKHWFVAVYMDDARRCERLAHLLRDGDLHGDWSSVEYAWDHAWEERRLDLLDATLHLLGVEYAEHARPHYQLSEPARRVLFAFRRLDQILTEGSCLLQAADEGHGDWVLSRRVSEEETAAFDDASASGTASAVHLRSAWRACFRRDADPATAYREAVLAVEGAAGAALLPADGKPSLGKAVAGLTQSSGAWTVAGLDRNASDSDATLVAMLQTLQRNDRRHAGPADATSDPVTAEEAQVVVFLAVTLVRWFEQGLVRNRKGGS